MPFDLPYEVLTEQLGGNGVLVKTGSAMFKSGSITIRDNLRQ